jgi:tetratricopeptide (TPR) repeat protein
MYGRIAKIGIAEIAFSIAFFFGVSCPVWAQSYDELVARANKANSDHRYKDAETSAEQAIQLNQDKWEAYLLAGRAYALDGLFSSAINRLELALQRAPEEWKSRISSMLADAKQHEPSR